MSAPAAPVADTPLPSSKLFIVSYQLPVQLRRSAESGAWSAAWVEDDILARGGARACGRGGRGDGSEKAREEGAPRGETRRESARGG